MVAERWIFFQSFVDDLFQCGREIWIDAHRRRWSFVQDGIKHQCRSVSAEGHASSGHLVEHGTKGEEIAAPVERFAPGLLWRHVSDLSHGAAAAAEVGVDGCSLG